MARSDQIPDVDTNTPVLFVRVYNQNAGAIPPFGLARVTAIDEDGTWTVDVADVPGRTDLLVGGPTPIASGGYGQMSPTFPALAGYIQSAGDPEAGDIWGVAAGDWHLSHDGSGFAILTDGVNGLTLIQPQRHNLVELVEVVSIVASSGRYAARLVYYDASASTWANGIDVWYIDTRTTPGLNDVLPAVRVGYANGRPVYVAAGSTNPTVSALHQSLVSDVCTTVKSAIATCSGAVTLSGATWTDITGATLTFTVAKAASYLVVAACDMNGAGTAVVVYDWNAAAGTVDTYSVALSVDGSRQTPLAVFAPGHPSERATVGQAWLVSLAAGSHTLKLQGQRTSGTGSLNVDTNTQLAVHAEEVVTVEKVTVTVPGGTVTPATCTDDPSGCCSGSGSGSGSGVGVVTSCCPGKSVSSRLYISFGRILGEDPGTCTCLFGQTAPIDFNTLDTWTNYGGEPFYACDPGIGGNTGFDFGCDISGSPFPAGSWALHVTALLGNLPTASTWITGTVNCDPFWFAGTLVIDSTGCDGTVEVFISETPP